MDPLSAAASLITILHATTALISVCYDFKSALRKAPWSLSKLLEELKSLRNVLEALEALASDLGNSSATGTQKNNSLDLLLAAEADILNIVRRDLLELEQKLSVGSWVGKIDSKRRALAQAVGWRLSERDTLESLNKIQQHKATLSLALAADQTATIHAVRRATDSLQNQLEDMDVKFSRMTSSERWNKLISWLSPASPRECHEAAVRLHQSNTCDWFFSSDEFVQWSELKGGLLWISGLPGSGKTVLFSNTVVNLYESSNTKGDDVKIGFFYCDFREEDTQDPTNIIGSLVAQLCVEHTKTPDFLQQIYDHSISKGHQIKPSLDDLERALIDLSCNTKTILLVDALDECNISDHVLSILLAVSTKLSNIKVFVTSRNEPAIRALLRGPNILNLHLDDHKDDLSWDIRYYIDQRLQNDTKLQWFSSSMKYQVAESLRQGSAGMFRWAQCQLDSLSSLHTVKDVRAALTKLPQGLHETYEGSLSRVTLTNKEIVRRVLLWLSFSILPLTLSELREAIAIDEGLSHINDDSLVNEPNTIITLCGSLITVSPSGHVQLAHLSVREYLLSEEIKHSVGASHFAMDPMEAKHELAIWCLAYLNMRELSTGPTLSEDEFVERLQMHPMLNHSAIAWSYYVRSTTLSTKLEDTVLRFFGPQLRDSFMSWVQVLNASKPGDWNVYPKHAIPIYYAASFGMSDIVRQMTEAGALLNEPGSRYGGTALHAAVMRNHLPVIKILLAAGADAQQADFNKTTPLHTASARAHTEAMILLLEHGASKEATDCNGETPWDWAVNADQKTSKDVLLGRRLIATPAEEKVEEVWQSNVSYLPGFALRRRSGVESSYVISVQQ